MYLLFALGQFSLCMIHTNKPNMLEIQHDKVLYLISIEVITASSFLLRAVPNIIDCKFRSNEYIPFFTINCSGYLTGNHFFLIYEDLTFDKSYFVYVCLPTTQLIIFSTKSERTLRQMLYWLKNFDCIHMINGDTILFLI